MGGNVFAVTNRLTPSEYARVTAAVKSFLASAGVNKFGIPVEVKDKADLVKEFKGPAVPPYGDVDAIVGVPTFDLMESISRGLAKLLGSSHGLRGVEGRGRIRSILTDENYQVDLRFCFEDECKPLLAMRCNNDYVGFLGHMLYPFRLKLCDRGFVLKQQISTTRFNRIHSRSQDLLLTQDPQRIGEFLGLPKESLDGCTSFTVKELFDVVVKSKVYFHDNEFPDNYWDDKARSERIMFRKLRQHTEAYDGSFESIKDEEDPVRRQLRLTGKFPDEDVRRRWEDFVMEYFDKTEEGEAARVEGPRKELNFSTRNLYEWYPECMTQELALEVMKILRAKFGGGQTAFYQWGSYTDRKVIRAEVDNVLNEILEGDEKKIPNRVS